MQFRKIVALALALAVLPLAGAFARGAGGFTWGEQYAMDPFSNVDLGITTTGVYGYSVSHGGQRIGGFAVALHSDAAVPALDGGFVGAIAGQETRLGSLMTAVSLWTGFGASNFGASSRIPETLSLFAELTVEAGLAFVPGVIVTGYAGMQAVAPVLLDQGTIGEPTYTPVIGLRVAWGS